MTIYNVHLFREMRLSFEGIEADTPEAAATIARDMSADDAQVIDDCGGETFAALVDVAGEDGYEQSRLIDFGPGRQRDTARALLAALQGVIAYVENEAFTLEKLKDSPEAEREAEHAWSAVEAANAAIGQASESGMTGAEVDIHALLAARRQIAEVWSVEDVLAVRPGLDGHRAWEVLRAVRRFYDPEIGITWDVLRDYADGLFGGVSEGSEAAE